MNSAVLQTSLSGLYVNGNIYGENIKFLIDTGSSVSILARRIFQRISRVNALKVREFTERLVLADGSQLPVHGVIDLPLAFEGITVEHPVIIAEIESDMLLGIDFIKDKRCELSYGEGVFRVEDTSLELFEASGQLSACRITAENTVILPPHSEMIVPGVVQKRSDLPRCAITESVTSLKKEGVLLGRVLVDPTKRVVPLRVLNPGDSTVVLPKDANLAIASPVTDVRAWGMEGRSLPVNQVSTESDDTDVTSCVQGPLPKHLQDLLDRSGDHLTVEQKAKMRKVIFDYSCVFSSGPRDIGRTGIIKHQIKTGDNKPVRLPPRKIPIHLKEAVNTEIDRLLDMKIIRPSTSPWSSCVVVVRKPNGEIRICLDVRAVNARSQYEHYPLPRMDTCLETLNGSEFYTVLDLASGFHQIELNEDDACKTAFSIPGRGSFEYETLPFGLHSGPSTCQRLMELVMLGLSWKILLIYIDDIIVLGINFEEALENLVKALKRLKEANLKVKTSKCVLFQESVSFLGHKVSKQGIETCPEKVKKVREWPTPENVTDIQAFLGLCSYYKNFIPNYGDVAQPLNELNCKDVPFVWNSSCQSSFDKLKGLLTTAPILAYPNDRDLFILDTDASNYSISGVLSQVQGNKESVICYGSRTLTKCERNYCTTRRELLAVVYFIPYYKHFLMARKFLLRTDHASLAFLFRWKQPEGQIARWMELLGPYEFDIEHRPGKLHGNADALSRIPCTQCGDGISSDECEFVEDQKAKAKKILMKIKQSQGKTSQHTVRAIRESEGGTPKSGVQNGAQANMRPNWLGGYTSQDLTEMQRKDNKIKYVLERMEANEAKPTWDEISAESPAVKALCANWDRLKLIDGVLYRYYHMPTASDCWQLIVPEQLKTSVIAAVHDSRSGSHLGKDRTLHLVKCRAYWYKYQQDVIDWVKKCHKCNSKKPTANQKCAVLQPFPVGAPMERIGIDISGKWPKTENGNIYILVIGDYFTKFIDAFPMPNMEAETVAEILVTKFLLKYGIPRIILSDQGSQFMSNLFKKMLTLFDIHQVRTSGFRPQVDGFIERSNFTIENMLAMCVAKNQKDWDAHLPYVMSAYRNTIQKSTGFSPNFLMFGREIEMPLDLIIGRPKDPHIPTENEYAQQLREKLEGAHEIARKNLKMAAVSQKRYYNVKVKESGLKKGDRVWVHFPTKKTGLSPKLTCKWQGPFTVLECIGEVNYKVRLNPRNKAKVVHRDRLRPYFGPNPDVNFPEAESDIDLGLDCLFQQHVPGEAVQSDASSCQINSERDDGYDADLDACDPPALDTAFSDANRNLSAHASDASPINIPVKPPPIISTRRSKRERHAPNRLGEWQPK